MKWSPTMDLSFLLERLPGFSKSVEFTGHTLQYVTLRLMDRCNASTMYLGIYPVGPVGATCLDIVGNPSPSFFTAPTEELHQLRNSKKQKQAYSKMYTDEHWTAKEASIAVGEEGLRQATKCWVQRAPLL